MALTERGHSGSFLLQVMKINTLLSIDIVSRALISPFVSCHERTGWMIARIGILRENGKILLRMNKTNWPVRE